MAGVLLYAYFLIMGFLYADMLFREKDIYFRSWMGGVFGNVMLMAGIMPFAFIFGFSALSHILLAAAAVLPYIILKITKREKLSINLKGGEIQITNKIFLCLILPVSAIIWVLMTNHILAPYDGGGVSSGQCTYGDLQMHLSFVTSIAEQGDFPPLYCQLSGTALNYPFLVDMLSSSLYLFGTPLRWAVLIPSYVMSLLIVMGFYILALKLTGRKSVAVLAVVLFFFNGGFGFLYFIDGAKADPSAFKGIFTEYYKTPTNYVDENVRWVNTICDMIIPQRTTMAGWCTILPALWLLIEGIRTKKTQIFAVLGVLAGCMPMIHTHSFLALGIISAVMLLIFVCSDKERKLKNWLLYGGIACIMAFPQLIFWTFRQTSGNESFLRLAFNWANESDTYFWFYLKNWGITALFLIPAVMQTSRENKNLAIGCAAVLILAETVVFQPNKYDNNKLLFVVYMISVILVSEYLVYLYDKLKGVRGRAFLSAVIISAGTLSGVLTIGREYVSGAQYQTFTEADISFAEYLKENTPADAVFLTGTQVTNPVSALAGRTLYLGSSAYVYFHGFGKEFSLRDKKVKQAYSGSYENMKKFCSENNISYIFVGRSESNDYNINTEMLSKLEKVYSNGGNSLYKVK